MTLFTCGYCGWQRPDPAAPGWITTPDGEVRCPNHTACGDRGPGSDFGYPPLVPCVLPAGHRERCSDTLPLVTVEVSSPGSAYTLLDVPSHGLVVHLAGPSASGGTGPCLCRFDRFAEGVGFSVGGGVTGPGVTHLVCDECLRLAGTNPVRGTHAGLVDHARKATQSATSAS